MNKTKYSGRKLCNSFCVYVEILYIACYCCFIN